MKIGEQVSYVREALAEWARGEGGDAEIASDPVHLFALLAARPGAVRACVVFRGEEKRGQYEESSMVDRKFLVVVSRGKGFTRESSDSLVKGAGGGRPLYDLVEEAREVVRGLSFDPETTETTADVKGIELFPMPGDAPAVDAYQVEFWIGTLLPAAGERELVVQGGNGVAVEGSGVLLA